jgi:hypothetical protein
MKTTILKLTAFSLILLLLLATVGCRKQELNDSDFCLCADIENFYKTAPFINNYLKRLSKNNWSDEQKVLALAEWLKSRPCIIDAYLESIDVVPFSGSSPTRKCTIGLPVGTYAKIVILLDDNGIVRELVLSFSPDISSPNVLKASYYRYVEPKEVMVATKSDVTIDEMFGFINLFDLEVKEISSIGYSSTMQSDSLLYLLDNLKTKPYISQVYGNYIQERIVISGLLQHNMENKNYQADWIKSMNDYKLSKNGNSYILFQVPDGKEREWKTKFEDYEFAESVFFNYGYRMMENGDPIGPYY